jgi:hypothetical protein
MNITHLREQAKRQIETGQSLFTASGWAENTVTALAEIEQLQQANADLRAVLEKVEKACKATGNYIGQNGQLIKEVRAALAAHDALKEGDL